MKIKKDQLTTILYWVSIFILLLIQYYPVITDSRFFLVDDEAILYPIKSIKNFIPDYFYIRSLDFQPVRDLSFYYEYKIYKHFKIFLYRFDNLLIYYVSLVLLFRIAKKYLTDSYTRLLILVLAAHPLFAFSIYWVSARKHLLATMFILAAFNLYEEDKDKNEFKRSIYLNLLLLFSFLSQPIHLWAPFWMMSEKLYQKYFEKKAVSNSKIICFATAVVIAVVIGLGNVLFYGGRKVPGAVNVGGIYDFEHFSKIILAYSRYFYNALFPLNLHHIYAQDSLYNLVGIILFSLFIYVFYKVNNNVKIRLALIPLALVLVTVHRIGSFVSDTYALLFCILLFLSIYYYFNIKLQLRKKYIISISLMISMLFSYLTWSRSKLMIDSVAFFKNDAINEPNPPATAYYINALMHEKKYKEGVFLFNKFVDSLELETVIPASFFRDFATTLFYSSDFYDEYKLKILSHPAIWCSSAPLFRSLLLLKQGKYDLAFTEIKLAVGKMSVNDPLRHQILSVYFYFCSDFGERGCMRNFYYYQKQYTDSEKVKLENIFGEVGKFYLFYRDIANTRPPTKTFYYYHDDSFYDLRVLLGMALNNLCLKFYKNY